MTKNQMVSYSLNALCFFQCRHLFRSKPLLLRWFLAHVLSGRGGDQDMLMGMLAEAPFTSRPQFGYRKHAQLILDVVRGRGGIFSLEGPDGVRLLTRSRVFTQHEIAQL